MPTKACHSSIQVEGLSRDADCVLKAMHFVSASRGYAIGGTGTDFNTLIVAKTEDDGNTWSLAPLPEVGNVWIGGAWGADHRLFFTDENTGFANPNNAKLLATNNGGQSWHGVVASPTGDIRGHSGRCGSTTLAIHCRNDCEPIGHGNADWSTPLRAPNSIEAFSSSGPFARAVLSGDLAPIS